MDIDVDSSCNDVEVDINMEIKIMRIKNAKATGLPSTYSFGPIPKLHVEFAKPVPVPVYTKIDVDEGEAVEEIPRYEKFIGKCTTY
jgi:hypothetical protein